MLPHQLFNTTMFEVVIDQYIKTNKRSNIFFFLHYRIITQKVFAVKLSNIY